MRKLIIILFTIVSFNLNAQNKQLDSLWSVWNDTTELDTNRMASLTTYVRFAYLFNQPDSAFYYLQLQFKLAESKQDKKWMASGRSLQGVTFHIQGNYYQAIRYYNESLKYAEEIGEKKMIANALNNIGIIHKEQKNNDKALEYFKRSFKIKKEIGDKMGYSNTLGNIGSIYSIQGNDELAIDYYNRGLRIQEEVGNKRGVATFLNNIGSTLVKRKEPEKAMEYFQRSLVLRKEIGDMKGQASCMKNISELYMISGRIQEAITVAKEGLDIANRSGALSEAMECAGVLYKAYKHKGDYKNAVEMYELYTLNKDSIGSENNQQEVIRQTFKYEYEKQHMADSLAFVQEQNIKDVLYQSSLEKEQNRRYFLYAGIGFLIILGGLIFRGYQSKKRDHAIIEESHKELAEKNQEIMDSINYAKRIQNAILPAEKVVKEYLKDSFIIYKPKDIVAGDFYWMEQKDGKTMVAAADCTGHGVPGAMVSVVCNNGLNRSVREHGLTDPGKILDKTREIVIDEFEKSEEDVKDGMDIALITINNNKLEYAGAHNPLWIIRNNEIIEYKANKQPIGKFDQAESFLTHQIELQKGDSIYIFTDGYVDQFGGEDGKKYKVKAFRDLLLSIQDKSMQEQRKVIDDTFETWKGKLEQVDDVCVIGVKI